MELNENIPDNSAEAEDTESDAGRFDIIAYMEGGSNEWVYLSGHDAQTSANTATLAGLISSVCAAPQAGPSTDSLPNADGIDTPHHGQLTAKEKKIEELTSKLQRLSSLRRRGSDLSLQSAYAIMAADAEITAAKEMIYLCRERIEAAKRERGRAQQTRNEGRSFIRVADRLELLAREELRDLQLGTSGRTSPDAEPASDKASKGKKGKKSAQSSKKEGEGSAGPTVAAPAGGEAAGPRPWETSAADIPGGVMEAWRKQLGQKTDKTE